MNINNFIKNLPKAELHVHLEGTLEPELMLSIAERNKIPLPYTTVDDIEIARSHRTYESFAESFIQGTSVLKRGQDFYDIAYAYLKKVSCQGVLHAEITFDTQTYSVRNIPSAVIINALHEATMDAQRDCGISSKLILCFLRHLKQSDALNALHESLQYKDKITAVGLASMEANNPPFKFCDVFHKAREYGYRTTAHAGEHAGAEYIWQALNDLRVDRIDHGVRCMEDPALVEYLRNKQIPLTVCPLSNYTLGVVPSLALHPFKKMLDTGLLVSLHSDDPVYFGGYIQQVYEQTQQALNLSVQTMIDSARNSFLSSFLDDSTKSLYIDRLIEYVHNNNNNNE